MAKFHELSKKQQAAYLKKHPNSKYHKRSKARTDKRKGVTKSGAKAGWGSTRGLAAKRRSGKHPASRIKRRPALRIKTEGGGYVTVPG